MNAPHALCSRCGHFACKHFGYPGRESTSPQCTVMSMQPKSVGHDEIVKCICTKEAKDIRG